jgi:predicted nucleic acid-binding protein
MKFILDASVALKWVLQEPDSPKADALRQAYRANIHFLLAPEVFTVEVAHGLTKAARRNIIRDDQVDVLLAELFTTLPDLHASFPLIPRAVEIARQARISVYDCLYVALAERESCQFVTADQRLLRALGSAFPLVDLAAFP